LAKFQALEPAIDVRVDASEASLNLEREGLDLAVRLGPPQTGEADPPPLLQEQVMLVAAPAIAARIACAADILHMPLRGYYGRPAVQKFRAWIERELALEVIG